MLLTWLTDTVTPDLDRAVHYTLLWGLEGVVLRRVGKGRDRVPHVNQAKLARRLAEDDLPLVAIVPDLFEGAASDRAGWLNEIATLPETLRFCKRMACRLIVGGAFASEPSDSEEAASEGTDLGSADLGRADLGRAEADLETAATALRRAADAVGRAGCRLAVRNAPDSLAPTALALADLLDRADHPALAAAWDPAAAFRAGEAPDAGHAALAGRLALVFASDGKRAGAKWTPTVFGDGALGWRALLGTLTRAGYDGPLCLEVESAAELPAPKVGVRAATALAGLERAARTASR